MEKFNGTRACLLFPVYPYKKLLDGKTTITRTRIDQSCNSTKPRVYTSIRRGDKKCITFDIPFKRETKVVSHSILLNNSVFENKRLPKHGFEVSFNYPNQTLRATAKEHTWKSDRLLLNQGCEEDDGDDPCPSYQNSTYSMIFDIDNISVLKRRNKAHDPCIENWKNDDMEVRSIISKEHNCRC